MTTVDTKRMVMDHKVIFVIQARTGSTRLPRKVLQNITDGFSMLDVIINRLLTKFPSSNLWVATTREKDDRLVKAIADKYNLNSVTGDSFDVLSRFETVCADVNPEWVVRVTGDNPLTCPELCMSLIEQAMNTAEDIVHISDKKSYRRFPQGMVAEIVRADTLMHLRKSIPIDQAYHLTHVTSSIPDKNKAEFELLGIPEIAGMRLTVDEYADLEMIRAVFRNAGKDWRFLNIKDIHRLKMSKPYLFLKNKNVKQKDIRDG